MGGGLSFLPPFRKDSSVGRKPSRQVLTAYGVVEGYQVEIDGDRQVDIFLGIPFAKPPIGELRFKKPVSPEAWKGVRKARNFGPRAIQVDIIGERWTSGVAKSEDCLYLNVFTPNWPAPEPEKSFAVLVYVHGGAFLLGSAVKYGDEGIARGLCRNDVIVVTIQYRLGWLGFFTTGDSVCPGNLALWDQRAALLWIRENIAAFGGDPRRVTVLGHSAGGVCIDMLAFSPKTRDLFQQVVPMAGNAECEWATVSADRVTEACRRFADRKGFVPTSENG